MATPMPPSPDYPSGTARLVPGGPSETIVEYETYASAQRAVDHLSDSGFPVGEVSIVGTDLRLVERVLGRWTVARAAGAGALTGAWFGLLVGLLLSIFTTSGWLVVIIVAVLVGAAWGAIFGAVAQAATRGQRDFTSQSTLLAGRYAVMVSAERADEARQLLTRFTAAPESAG